MATAQEDDSTGTNIAIVCVYGFLMCFGLAPAIMILKELSLSGRWSLRTRTDLLVMVLVMVSVFGILTVVVVHHAGHSWSWSWSNGALNWVLLPLIFGAVPLLVLCAGLAVIRLGTGRWPEGFWKDPPAPPRQPGEGMDLEEWARGVNRHLQGKR